MADYTGQSFYWVMNDLDIECDLPIKFSLNTENKLAMQFDRANSDQNTIIRKHINQTVPKDFLKRRPPYEYDWIYEDNGEPVTTVREVGRTRLGKPRDEKDCRYFVISYPAGNEYSILLGDLGIIFSLLNIPLQLGFNYINYEDGIRAPNTNASKSDRAYYEHLTDLYSIPEKINCDSLIADIKSIPDMLEKLHHLRLMKNPISRVIYNYTSVLSLPYESQMSTLGLFTVLEGLITHKPGGPDTKDSLIHQLSNKMSLLNRRFDIPLNYDKYFNKDFNEVKIWKLLYDYRSRLAHGDDVDFNSGDYKKLGKKLGISNAGFVREFMLLVVRTTLRNALNEPDLYLDLSKC